jgi:hypothetical protein
VTVGAGGGSADATPALAHSNLVSGAYFETLGTELILGRGIEATDRFDAPAVAVVDEEFVSRFWPTSSGLGETFMVGGDLRPVTVVGVVEGVKTSIYNDPPAPTVYLPIGQRGVVPFDLVMESRLPAGELAQALFSAVADVDPALVAGIPGPLEGRTSLAALPQVVGARLIGSLALIALLLSGIGLYGVIGFDVSRRTPEIGIHRALGASVPRVVRGIFARTAWIVVPAMLLGGVAASAVAKVVGVFLVGVGPRDPITIVAVVLALSAVAAVATLIPAVRAARVEPVIALRSE